MSEKKIVIPEGMRDAAMRADESWYKDGINNVTRAEYIALSVAWWLSENPITLSLKDAKAIAKRAWAPNETCVMEIAREAQRLMFLAPEPEYPAELKALLADFPDWRVGPNEEFWAEKIIAAWKLGKEQKP